VLALLLLGLGLVVAKLAERGALALVRRLARVVGSVMRGASPVSAEAESLARTLGRLAYWLVVVVSVLAASELLRFPFALAWWNRWGTHLPRVLGAVVIVAAGSVGARVARHVVVTAAGSAGIGGASRLGRAAYVVVLFGTWLLAAEQLGLEVSFLKDAILIAIAALLGSASLAFGLGGGRVVTSILRAHFVHKLYRVGQRVQVDGVEGQISRITPLAIVVDDGEGQVVVPARRLASGTFRILGGTRG
jgi:hypothetical protein